MTSTRIFHFHVIRNGVRTAHAVDAVDVREAVATLRGGFYDDIVIVGWG